MTVHQPALQPTPNGCTPHPSPLCKNGESTGWNGRGITCNHQGAQYDEVFLTPLPSLGYSAN